MSPDIAAYVTSHAPRGVASAEEITRWTLHYWNVVECGKEDVGLTIAIEISDMRTVP